MTFDEFFSALPNVPGGTIFMAMPRGADMSTVRLIAYTLLPTGIEIVVDDEVVFLYANLEEFDMVAYQALSETQRQIVAAAVRRYRVVLRAFLSIYTCRGYRLWASV